MRRDARVMGQLCLAITMTALFTYTVQPSEASEGAAADCAAIEAGKLYRYVEGIDTCMVPLSKADLDGLGDTFARALLAKGKVPGNQTELAAMIAETLGLGASHFVVGEGAHVPVATAPRDAERYLRTTTIWGKTPYGFDISSSKLGPLAETGMLEIMSSDDAKGEYNYYLIRQQLGADSGPFALAWVGNSKHAQAPETRQQGCFSCHHNGLPIMRELETPWQNWSSQRFWMSSTNLPEASAAEPSFVFKKGGEILEQILRGRIVRYYERTIDGHLQTDGAAVNVSDVPGLLRHVLTTTTINLKASDVPSNPAHTKADDDIYGVPPRDTFLADTLLRETLRVPYDGLSLTLSRSGYDAWLEEHGYHIKGTPGFDRSAKPAWTMPGSTYFAYSVPQVAAEDIQATQLLLARGVIGPKFVAAALMVDFRNPLFSEKRASLMRYAEAVGTGRIENGKSSIPAAFVAEVEKSGARPCAKSYDDCTAEEQFLHIWSLPDADWRQRVAARLDTHVASIATLGRNDQLEELMRYAVQQRDRMAGTLPFCHWLETDLLFPSNTLSPTPRCPK